MKKLVLILFALFAFSGLALAVDINAADQAQLEGVKGIGPVKAKAIVDYRSKNGPFKSVDELKNVRGFDDKSIAKMKGELSVGGAGRKTDPAAASKKADETMSKDAPRTLPAKDAKPGPTEKSGAASSRKPDETMTKDAPRKYPDEKQKK